MLIFCICSSLPLPPTSPLLGSWRIRVSKIWKEKEEGSRKGFNKQWCNPGKWCLGWHSATTRPIYGRLGIQESAKKIFRKNGMGYIKWVSLKLEDFTTHTVKTKVCLSLRKRKERQSLALGEKTKATPDITVLMSSKTPYNVAWSWKIDWKKEIHLTDIRNSLV